MYWLPPYKKDKKNFAPFFYLSPNPGRSQKLKLRLLPDQKRVYIGLKQNVFQQLPFVVPALLW